MAAVTRKSTALTNRDALPNSGTTDTIARGAMRQATGYVSAVSGDTSASLYPLVTVPSNARISAIQLNCAALGSADKVDVGVYWPTLPPPLAPGISFGTVVAGGAVGSSGSNFFASAYNGVSAAQIDVSVINSNSANSIPDQELELWNALGLTQDPNSMFDIAVVPNKNGSGINGSGYIGLRVTWCE